MFAGTLIQCTVPHQCVEPGNILTVTCIRSLGLSSQTRIIVQTEDKNATGIFKIVHIQLANFAI